jgi:hypothetical protein
MIVAGIELSSDSPVFLTALGFHVLAGMACVGSGAVAMLSAKLMSSFSKSAIQRSGPMTG